MRTWFTILVILLDILCIFHRKSPQPPFQGGAGSLLFTRSARMSKAPVLIYNSPLKRGLGDFQPYPGSVAIITPENEPSQNEVKEHGV